MKIETVKKELRRHADPAQAKVLQGFFKTGPGEYGEGDVFIGVKIPGVRATVKLFYKDLSLEDTVKLLKSNIHEERLVALFIMVFKFREKAGGAESIYRAYINNTKYINNWDLVDLSAPQVVGMFLKGKPKKILYRFVRSDNMWERRIAIIATAAYIKEGEFNDTLKIADILLSDEEDLIHKAVGWMLREVGKKDVSVLEEFLKTRYKNMPRTMLRYAIEKFPEHRRQAYLKGLV